MKNSQSSVSQDIHDQYYTSVQTAEWCLNHLKTKVKWKMTGTVLEPCVGMGNFVTASENLGYKLKWITNDLFPSPHFVPDTQEDIRTVSPTKKPDFIITNPPFGSTNSLARASLKHCLTICDRVAMILPKGARRMGFQDAQPEFAHLVDDVNVPEMVYELPDGTLRSVLTCLQTWEVKDTPRENIRAGLDLRTDFISHWASGKEDFRDKGYGPADFQVNRWGGKRMNTIRDEMIRSGAWMSVKIEHPTATVDEVKETISSIDVSDYFEKSTCNAAFDPPMWLHRVNTEAVRRGFLTLLTS